MTGPTDTPGDETAAPDCPEEDEDPAMVEAQLRELMPRAARGDLGAVEGVLDLLARRDRDQEEWMRWLWPARDGEPGRGSRAHD